jgi:hypothetical protein
MGIYYRRSAENACYGRYIRMKKWLRFEDNKELI